MIQIVFLTVIVALAGGLHYYLWVRLVRDPGWPAPLPTIGMWTLIVLGAAVPLAMGLHRFLPRWASTPLAGLAYVWMGACFFLLVLTFTADIVRWMFNGAQSIYDAIASSKAIVDEERRQVVARGAATAIGLAAVGATGASLREGLAEVHVKEIEVPMKRLPKALEGFTIVQLTDIHIGPTIGRKFMDALVEKTNALKPDVVAITGDLVDGQVSVLSPHTDPLAQLKARYGRYFVTGNHEYYSGVTEWTEYLNRIGIRVLRNERVSIGDASASIDLAGVDDWTAQRFGHGHGADIERALKGRDIERELVLLAHQPKQIDDAARLGVGLQISGHTHGGQIWPFNNIVHLVQPYVAGLFDHNDLTKIYVSRGAGYWGPPMRLFAPAEITKLVLVSG